MLVDDLQVNNTGRGQTIMTTTMNNPNNPNNYHSKSHVTTLFFFSIFYEIHSPFKT